MYRRKRMNLPEDVEVIDPASDHDQKEEAFCEFREKIFYA